MPTDLAVKVKKVSPYQTHADGFADIFQAVHNRRLVALKQLTMFRRRRYHKSSKKCSTHIYYY